MNRNDLQELSKLRMKDARLLLSGRQDAAAYYLTGYAVECALKACIAKQVRRHDFPDKRTVQESHTHDLLKLIKIAGLVTDHDSELKSNPQFALNWTVVKDWSEEARYSLSISSAQARDIYSAVVARKNGVLSWVRKRW